jgi:hypothetical protein
MSYRDIKPYLPDFAGMNLAQFRQYLSSYDWYSFYSDDAAVWRAGQASWDHMLAWLRSSAASAEFKNAFDEAYMGAFPPDKFPGSKPFFSELVSDLEDGDEPGSGTYKPEAAVMYDGSPESGSWRRPK